MTPIDRSKLLIYTNSVKVWRTKSRGDYWVLDVASSDLWQLGGSEAEESSLQFAKFSPDATRVAYVRKDNIYVQELDARSIVEKGLGIAGDICIYTNHNRTIEQLEFQA